MHDEDEPSLTQGLLFGVTALNRETNFSLKKK